MGWGNLRSWVKGGIIGALAGLIILLSLIMLMKLFFIGDNFALYLFPTIFFGLMGMTMQYTSPSANQIVQFVFLVILAFVPYFIIGSIVGWIIGKIKKE